MLESIEPNDNANEIPSYLYLQSGIRYISRKKKKEEIFIGMELS